jgi:hypothetical protein
MCSSLLVIAIKSNTNYVPFKRVAVFSSHKNYHNRKLLFFKDSYHKTLHDPILPILFSLPFPRSVRDCHPNCWKDGIELHDIKFSANGTKVLCMSEFIVRVIPV